jgi:hypothetical protein
MGCISDLEMETEETKPLTGLNPETIGTLTLRTDESPANQSSGNGQNFGDEATPARAEVIPIHEDSMY